MQNTFRTATLVLGAMAAGTVAIAAGLSGTVQIDGSSTVGPVSTAMAEAYAETESDVNVTVGISGTGGGFRRFGAGEIDISDASRPIKPSEARACAGNSINFIEIPVALDGLSVIISRDNNFVTQLTVDQLRTIYSDASIDSWDDVNPAWPNVALHIYGPGTQSGTYDFFKSEVMGSESFRADIAMSEDDNDLVRGVSGNRGGIAYLGMAYYEENTDALKAVPIVNADGNAILPSVETVTNGTYPLSRPLFIYVNASSLSRPEVSSFVDFYLSEMNDIAEEVGYVALPQAIVDAARTRLRNRVTGSCFIDAAGNQIRTPFLTTFRAN